MNKIKKFTIINLFISILFLLSSCSTIDKINKKINSIEIFDNHTFIDELKPYSSYYEYKCSEIVYFKIDNRVDDKKNYNKIYCIGERLDNGNINSLEMKENEVNVKISNKNEIIYRRKITISDNLNKDNKSDWEIDEVHITNNLLKNSYMSFKH